MSSNPIRVHLLPELIRPEVLRGGVAVVVDVLRATTSMVHALAAGALEVVPFLEIEDARAFALGLDPGSALLGGERQGVPIPGFDLGNSPASYSSTAVLGKTIVMTTTNGTRALLASLEADLVLVGAFSNLGATLDALREGRRPIHIVCAGTDRFVSWEDTLLAGAYVDALDSPDDPTGPLDDSARIASTCWRAIGGSSGLRDALERGRGGRRVRELEMASDFEAVAAIDRFPDLIAEVRIGPTRVARRG